MPPRAPFLAATAASTWSSRRPGAASSTRRRRTTASRPSRWRPARSDVRALIKTASGVGNIAVQNARMPEPGPGEALVRIARSGLCGTDLLVYDDVYRGRTRAVPYPLILGHEAAGEVVAFGPGASGP